VLKGWGNYFRLGSVSKAYRAVDSHVRNRLRRWLSKKHQSNNPGHKRFSDQYLKQNLGLFSWPALRLTCRERKHKQPCPKAGRGKTAHPV
jgi:RNA-directed DNA polymerase